MDRKSKGSFSRSHKPYRPGYDGKPVGGKQHYQQRKASPMPLGEMCNPLCPLFRCTRGALFIYNRSYRGKIIKEAYCRLTGDKCVGYECQYASCRINALLPDGKCAKALEKKYRSVGEEELFREMREFEDYDAEDFA